VDLVALLEQELGEVRAVLASDTWRWAGEMRDQLQAPGRGVSDARASGGGKGWSYQR